MNAPTRNSLTEFLDNAMEKIKGPAWLVWTSHRAAMELLFSRCNSSQPLNLNAALVDAKALMVAGVLVRAVK